jgi:hypothetical protein
MIIPRVARAAFGDYCVDEGPLMHVNESDETLEDLAQLDAQLIDDLATPHT